MKKTFIALAAAAMASAASAQGSVTVFGRLDLDLAHFSQNGLTKTIESHSGNAPSQLGFRGTEDLGSGYSANFYLAGGLSPDDASSAFSFGIRSTISLAGPLGELRFGRDYPVGSLNQGAFDPFGNMGVASGANLTLPVIPGLVAAGINPLTSIRVNNSIEYMWGFAPNALAIYGTGFYGDVQAALPENTNSTPPLGRYTGIRAGYAVGQWNICGAYAESTGPFGTPGPRYMAVTSFKESNLGASYSFNGSSVMGHVGINDSNMPNSRYSHWALGAQITAGLGYIPISYISSRQNNAAHSNSDQIAAGYVYNLSKRTALYTAVARITNRNGATNTFVGGNAGNFPTLTPGLISSPGNGTGYDFGVRTVF